MMQDHIYIVLTALFFVVTFAYDYALRALR